MAELLLVRHAATAWSGRRYCGRSDPPLDDTGLAALTRLASELRPWLRPGFRIVSSPLKRARQTAAAIASVVVPTSVELDARWAEVDFGIADGLTFDELTLVAPVIAARLAAGEVAIDWPGGETAAALTDRVETAWRDLASRGSPALVVSHGGPLRVAIGLATGRPQFEVQVPPTAGIWRGNLSPSAVTGRSED